jgi:hypothetical protein
VSVSVIATNATCFGQTDGSIAVTNSEGSTVVITNANNEVVVILDLLLERILTATANGGNDSCTATAQVTYLNLKFRCLLAVSLQMLLVLSTDGSIAVTNSEGSRCNHKC